MCYDELEPRHDEEPLTAIAEDADPRLEAPPGLGRDRRLAEIPVQAVADLSRLDPAESRLGANT
jgi:hypothetical protein